MPAARTPVRLVPLGGLGEVGMNCLVVEQGDDRVLVDCGIMFPSGDTSLGVEVIAPDLAYLMSGPAPQAVLLTHAHEDHIGALPYLLRAFPDLTLCGSRFTLALVKEKLAEHGYSPRTVEVSPNKSGAVGSIAFEPLQVPHSIPDALGYALRTDAGMVLHTGDFKVDWSPVDGRLLDVRRFSELGEEGVACLLSDSTNAEREGTSTSEREVSDSLGRIFAGPLAKTGRVVVALFSSNIHRVQSVVRASLQQGRKICLLGRSMQTNVRLALDLGYLKCPPDLFIDPETADHFAPRELTVLCTGAQGEPRSALARLAQGEHPTIQLDKGDLVIMSSRSIPGNERLVGNLIDDLVRKGCRVLGGVSGGSELVHATGHACQGEQRMMIDLVRPRSFLPIHGEYRMLVAHSRLAEAAGVPRILVAEDGDIVELRAGELGYIASERAQTGRIYLDTRASGGVGAAALRDRQLLADSGVLVCLVVLDGKTGELVRGPELLGKGVAHLDEKRLAQARGAATEALRELSPAQRTEPSVVEEALRLAVRSAWKKNVEKRPMVMPVVVQL